jgi:hypothetical protein
VVVLVIAKVVIMAVVATIDGSGGYKRWQWW